ncbi:Ubiquinone biosynthesis monooxygenase COQ6 mitochondrial, partial [Fasciolopsis buskii]
FHRIHDFDLQTRPNAPTPPEARVLSLLGQLVVGMADRCCGRSVTSSSPNHPPIAPEISHLQSGTKRAKFPLGFQHANNYHAPRAVLVGDAAHRILPLAGQGVNLGFGDVISLYYSHVFTNHVRTVINTGSPVFLQDYTTDRQRAVVPVAATMELLNLLYSTDAFGFKLFQVFCPGQPSTERTANSYTYQLLTRLLTTIRSAGLSTVQSSTLIKDFLVNAAITGQLGISLSN